MIREEEDAYDHHPGLRGIVDSIRIHAGPGWFYALTSGCFGWIWDDIESGCTVHLDTDSGPLLLISFDCLNMTGGDDGPVYSEDGLGPTLALADACGRWIAARWESDSR